LERLARKEDDVDDSVALKVVEDGCWFWLGRRETS